MERRDRVKEARANAIAGLLAIIITVAVIFLLTLRSTRYERDAADHFSTYARTAEREITRRCSNVPPSDYAQCVSEGENAKRENERKEQELVAQRVTAWWTLITGAAAVAGVLLSAFGVFLVYRTFRATRQANEIASGAVAETAAATKAMIRQNELTEIAQRPWVTLNVRVTKFEDRPHNVAIGIAVEAKNIGQSVALDLRMDVAVQQRGRVADDRIERVREIVEDQSTFKIPLVPGDTTTNWCEYTVMKKTIVFDESGDGDRAPFSVFAAVRYRSHGDPEVKATERSWQIGEARHKDDPLNEWGIPYPISEGLTADALMFFGSGDTVVT